MAMSLRTALILVGLSLCCAACAQPASSDLSGTITLNSGEKVTGVIKAAELGVVLGSGLGSLQESHGMLQVKDGDQTVQVPAADLRTADVEWANTGSDAEPRWSIAKLTLTRQDGTVVSGVPTWTLQFSTLWVVTAEGDRRVEAYPLSPRNFKPGNLMKRIVIGAEPEEVVPEPVTPVDPPVVEPTPVTPVEPVEPPVVEPTPVTPVEPVEPPVVEPTPVTPVEPVEPPVVEPTPVTPVEPVEPPVVEPTPVAPVEPVEPPVVEPTPVTPVEPVEPPVVEPTPVTPVEPVEPPVVEPTPVAPVVPAVPVPCKITFAGLSDAAETARVGALISAQATGGEVAVATDAAGQVTMSFTLPDMAALPALVEAIKTRLGPTGTPQAAFEELSRELSLSFRTASLQGAIVMTVHFTVTPGSQLFVSLSPGAESQVDAASISPTGDATLTVQLPRGERFVYARSVLGAVEKCICLDVLTGDAAEVTREQYLTHQ